MVVTGQNSRSMRIKLSKYGENEVNANGSRILEFIAQKLLKTVEFLKADG